MYNILYVEDDECMSEITLERLKHPLLNITHVTYANDGYRNLRTTKYDMILTDNLTLPHGTGTQMINRFLFAPERCITDVNVPIAIITSDIDLAKTSLDKTDGISFFGKIDGGIVDWVFEKLNIVKM